MPFDRAQIGIEWDVPANITKESILNGPISIPIMLILHGIHNDASFGYVRSVTRICVRNGWIAIGMKF